MSSNEVLEERIKNLTERVEVSEADIKSLKSWQSYVMGAAVAIGAIVGLFADNIKGLFK